MRCLSNSLDDIQKQPSEGVELQSLLIKDVDPSKCSIKEIQGKTYIFHTNPISKYLKQYAVVIERVPFANIQQITPILKV